jgi:ribonucleotide reductase beta subunit family protein with ferritin-like domain
MRKTLNEIGFPEDQERLSIIEEQLTEVVAKHLNTKHLKEIVDFYSSESGTFWVNHEINLLKDVEQLVAAHLALAKGEIILGQLGFTDNEDTNTH